MMAPLKSPKMNSSVSEPSRLPKLAGRLARRVTSEICDARLPPGTSLGSEASLATRLGASRWTVREALQILEYEGQIAIRRGRYGGIFVAAPSVEVIGTSIRSYLEFIRIDISEVVAARRILDEAILQLAAQRVTPTEISGLRSREDLESEADGVHAGFVQYEALLNAARSPVLKTFVRAVGQLGLSAILRSTLSDSDLAAVMRLVRLKRREQIEAVIAGQVADALSAESVILDATTRLLESARFDRKADTAAARLRALQLLTRARTFKRPQLLMQEIASDIIARGWPVGEHLGTEAVLLQHYGVSRSAFREAVRSLEQIGVVEMRTGRSSGLKVGSPDPLSVVTSSRRQFARMGVGASNIGEALQAVGAGASGLAAQRKPPNSSEFIPADDSTFFEILGKASGNRIIALFLRILTVADPGRRRTIASAGVDPSARTALRVGILAAIRSSDAALARRLFLVLHQQTGNTHVHPQ